MSTGDKIVQFTSFQASEAYLSDRSKFAGPLSDIKAADGHLVNYLGLQVPEEGGKTAFVISIWESREHLKNFAGHPLQVAGVESMKTASATGLSGLRRAQIRGIVGVPSEIFDAGEVTELVIIEAKDGSAAQAKEAAQKVQQTFASKGHNIGLGEAVDKEGWFIIIGAWPSYKESRSTVQNEPYASAIASLSAVASVDVFHANINKAD